MASNKVLAWIIETINFENLRILLETKLPILAFFQSALLSFCVRTNRHGIIKDLLGLDTGLKDFVKHSCEPLREAIDARSLEDVELILNAGFDVCGEAWRLSLVGGGLTFEIAKLLVDSGANVHTRTSQVSFSHGRNFDEIIH